MATHANLKDVENLVAAIHREYAWTLYHRQGVKIHPRVLPQITPAVALAVSRALLGETYNLPSKESLLIYTRCKSDSEDIYKQPSWAEENET